MPVRENKIEFNSREQVKFLGAGPRNSKSNHFSKARHPYRIFLGVIRSRHQCTECYVGLFTYKFSSLDIKFAFHVLSLFSKTRHPYLVLLGAKPPFHA